MQGCQGFNCSVVLPHSSANSRYLSSPLPRALLPWASFHIKPSGGETPKVAVKPITAARLSRNGKGKGIEARQANVRRNVKGLS